MVAKILGVISLVMLPLSAMLWHSSHRYPKQHRFDLTLYKSLNINLQDGLCIMELVSMPTKVASRTEFLAPLGRDPRPAKRSLMLSTTKSGAVRTTWLIFPFWLSTLLLTLLGVTPVVQGPIKRWWRRRNGWCIFCGYNLAGNRSGRCPECGVRYGRSSFAVRRA